MKKRSGLNRYVSLEGFLKSLAMSWLFAETLGEEKIVFNSQYSHEQWLVRGEPSVGLFAVREIQPGEELVFDYQMEFEHTFRHECLCGAANCAGFLGISTPTQRSPSPAESGALSATSSTSSKKSSISDKPKKRKLMKKRKDPAKMIVAKATRTIANLKRRYDAGAKGRFCCNWWCSTNMDSHLKI